MKAKKRFFSILKGVMTVLLLVVSLFPVYWMLTISVRQTEEMSGTQSIPLVPHSFTLEHFQTLFTEKNFAQALGNSVIVTMVSLVISLAFGIACAYVLARTRFIFRGKTTLTYWVLLVRILPPITFAVPLYIMFSRVGMVE